MSAMCKLYIRKIIDGTMTINDVPIKWREEVRQELENSAR